MNNAKHTLISNGQTYNILCTQEVSVSSPANKQKSTQSARQTEAVLMSESADQESILKAILNPLAVPGSSRRYQDGRFQSAVKSGRLWRGLGDQSMFLISFCLSSQGKGFSSNFLRRDRVLNLNVTQVSRGSVLH